jgi:hypothetical protein
MQGERIEQGEASGLPVTMPAHSRGCSEAPRNCDCSCGGCPTASFAVGDEKEKT